MTAPWLLWALALAACGGTARTHPGTEPPRGVEAAALPYKILRGQGGTEVAEAQFWTELGRARAICVGESHKNPHHHWAQLQVLQKLAGGAGVWALGLEMFQRPMQGVLDDYGRGVIDEEALISRSGWRDRWGHDFELYRPLLFHARLHEMALLALNAPAELTKKVAHRGLAALDPEEKAALPELDLEDPAHRAHFEEAMEGHELGGGDLENFYAAQVIWDETMAETAARWLAAASERRIIILAGSGHCHQPAIPRRLVRRKIELAVSILPVIDDGQGNVADLLASPRDDYLFVMSASTRHP
jgi:uncharacterized iron-regulated protein